MQWSLLHFLLLASTAVLFVLWKTSGSWCPVIDLSHLTRFVDVSHFQMETIQSVLLSVRQGDWMTSIDLKEAYLQVQLHPDSRHFLRFVSKGHVFQFKALCFGLSTALQVFSRVMAPVSAILHTGDLYAQVSRRLASPVVLSGIPPPGSPDCPRPLSRVGDCGQPAEIPPRSIPGGAVSRGCHQHLDFHGFSVAGAHLQAAVNCRRISVLRLASRELVALAAGYVFLRWLTWFLEADCGCGLSSCASIVLGIVRISRLRCLRRRSVSATSSGGSTFLASPTVCFSARCLPTSTSGQTPRTSSGVPIWISRSLPACVPPTRLRCP